MAIQDKYDIVNNTYVTKEKEFETEIGDIKQPNFEPQIKIKRWDNEANASFRLIDTSPDIPVVSIEGDKIKWVKDKIEVHFYDLGFEENKGGYEFEIILKEKPATNVLQFSIETKELDFFYQPELTQEEIDEGTERPDNVVGSYAVYHKTQQGDYTALGGKNYKAGKAFHVYRPRIIDAVGKWVWGELNINEQTGILSVTIPQGFLDTSVYPISHAAGLDFGYTTKGTAGTVTEYDDFLTSIFESIGAGTIASMSAYVEEYNDSYPVLGYAIYKDSDKSLIGNTETWVVTEGWSNWKTLDIISGGTVAATTDYWLGVHPENGWIALYWDDLASAGNRAVNINKWPDPITLGGGYSNRKFSVYATYTPAAPDTITIQKSLKYTVQTTPTAITKSLKYTVQLVPSATTKSLEYQVVPADKDYTRGDEATLPTNDNNLETAYVQDDYVDVASDNAVRINQDALSEFAIHLYKVTNENSIDDIYVTWNGQSDVAPSGSTIYLQIYNRTTASWETLDSNSAAAADTDFTLSGNKTTSLGDYYNGSNEVAIRVYQEST